MTRLMIIADDFTGALDTSVQFSMQGAKTIVLIPREDVIEVLPEYDVLVVDAETRHIPAGQAGNRVEKFAVYAIDKGISVIYKKTDSALRGNVGAELSALWRVGGQKQLHFLPAMPQMGRTTQNGVQMINEIPVAQSVFGADPFDPVVTSSVKQLIAEQSDVPVYICSALKGNRAVIEEHGIIVYDANTVEDLIDTGRCLQARGQLKILAGCAGFAACLPELLNINGVANAEMPCLDTCITVICGSVNPITVKQLDVAEKAGFLRFRLTPQQELEKGYWRTDEGERILHDIKKILCKYPLRIIDSNNHEGNAVTTKYAMEHGIRWEEIRIRVSETMGYLLKKIFQMPEIGTLLITGGDTLLQCMESIGIYEVEPITELSPGVVLFRFVYEKKIRYVISKSGGFGEENLILELINKLSEGKKYVETV